MKEQLETAKLIEVGLKEWKKALFDAHIELIQEMLRILNPEKKEYKAWYSAQERERFLKDIGFLKGTLQPTGGIQTLLAQMKKLYA